MSDSETFDAFYARTAWKVTSQMHSMTGRDSDPEQDPEQSQADHNQADHAVREAYARAYQQWYEVSGYRDPEAWVLQVAAEAFERRRAQAASAGLDLGATEKADPGTWPGIYRPRSAPQQEPAARVQPPQGLAQPPMLTRLASRCPGAGRADVPWPAAGRLAAARATRQATRMTHAPRSAGARMTQAARSTGAAQGPSLTVARRQRSAARGQLRQVARRAAAG